MIVKKFKIKRGLTLLEILVAVGMFAVLTLIIMRVFVRVTDVQQKIHQDQNTQGDLQYALGVLTKEAFNSKLQGTECEVGVVSICKTNGGVCNGSYYCLSASGNALCFVDQAGNCIQYYVSNQQLVVLRNATLYNLTSSDLQVQSLKFQTMSKTPSNPNNAINVQIKAQSATVSSSLIYFQTALPVMPR